MMLFLTATETVPLITYPATINAIVFGLLCLYYASKRGRVWVSIMVTGSLLGFVAEYLALKTPDSYRYCKFWPMILDTVPLMVVISWGGLIYCVMQASHSMPMKWWLRPVYDGLLAMGVDLSLDPIAIELDYWKYDTSNDQHWFGVPFLNYVGWFGLVFWYSLSIRFLIRWVRLPECGWKWQIGLPPLAALMAVIPFGILTKLYTMFVQGRPYEPVFFGLFFLLLLGMLVLYLPSVPHDAPLNNGALLAPLFFGVFQNLIIFAAPFFGRPAPIQSRPPLAILTPLTTLFVLVCFAWPFLDTIQDKLSPISRLARSRKPEVHPWSDEEYRFLP
jgi:hypothetical protein